MRSRFSPLLDLYLDASILCFSNQPFLVQQVSAMVPVDWLPQLQLVGPRWSKGPGKNYDPGLTAVAGQRAIAEDGAEPSSWP